MIYMFRYVVNIEDSCEKSTECAGLNNSVCQSSHKAYQNNKHCVCSDNYDFNEHMQCEKGWTQLHSLVYLLALIFDKVQSLTTHLYELSHNIVGYR